MSQISALSLAPEHTDRSVSGGLATRTAALAYGVASYALGVASLLTLIAVSLGVLDVGLAAPSISSTGAALAFDLALLVAFAVQHSVMARKSFKDRWTRLIRPSMERSTYLVATALFLTPLLLVWQPMPTVLWSVDPPVVRGVMRAIAVGGWAYLFAASFAINHFELFGLQQVWNDFRGRESEPVPFRERWMYAFDRHPIMTGVLIGMWVTPDMTVGRLTLVAGLSLYAFVGVFFEERALLRTWGESYADYCRRVGTIVPRPFARH